MYSPAELPPLVLELSANNVTAGEQLTASCTASVPLGNRVLHIDGQSIITRIENSRESSNSDGSTTTWTINPVQPGDAGEYSCIAGDQSTTDSDSSPQNVTVFCEFRKLDAVMSCHVNNPPSL